ncbi:MAG: hypothetical protein QXP83_06230 [Candidatus Nezhaarchaeales archaeon]
MASRNELKAFLFFTVRLIALAIKSLCSTSRYAEGSSRKYTCVSA